MIGSGCFFLDYPAIGFTCYPVVHVYRIPDLYFRNKKLLGYVSAGPNSSHALVSRRHWSDEANAGDTTLYKSTPPPHKKGSCYAFKSLLKSHKAGGYSSKPFLDPFASAMMSIYFPFGRQTRLAGNHRFFPFFLRKCMDPFVVDFSASYVWFTTDLCSWSCQATPWLQADCKHVC